MKKIIISMVAVAIVTLSLGFTETDYSFFVQYIFSKNYISSVADVNKSITKGQVAEIIYNQEQKDINMAREISQLSFKIYGENTFASGNLIGEDLILTCAHFVKKDTNPVVIVKSANGTVYNSKIVAIDYEKDLCVLRTNKVVKPSYKSKFAIPIIGEPTYLFGNFDDIEFIYTKGYVSSTNAYLSDIGRTFTLINSTTIVGYSGAVVYNSKMEVIGVSVRVSQHNSQSGFVVKTGDIIDFLKGIL